MSLRVVGIPFESLGTVSYSHSNYGRIFSRFDTIHERDRHPATARRQELHYAASLDRCSRAVKIVLISDLRAPVYRLPDMATR